MIQVSILYLMCQPRRGSSHNPRVVPILGLCEEPNTTFHYSLGMLNHVTTKHNTTFFCLARPGPSFFNPNGVAHYSPRFLRPRYYERNRNFTWNIILPPPASPTLSRPLPTSTRRQKAIIRPSPLWVLIHNPGPLSQLEHGFL